MEPISKSIFKSKIFWVQVLTAAQMVTGVLPVSAVTAGLIGQGLTAALRLFGTSQPTHIVNPE